MWFVLDLASARAAHDVVGWGVTRKQNMRLGFLVSSAQRKSEHALCFVLCAGRKEKLDLLRLREDYKRVRALIQHGLEQ